MRDGIDVFKALVLGPCAVFMGRPVIWGLVYNVSHKMLSVSVCFLNSAVSKRQTDRDALLV